MKSRASKAENVIVSAETARAVDAALKPWFKEHQRDLNFRKTRNGYAVMVSEFMLQQTTVATVEAYFARFMAQFPTVAALAAAREEDVLGAWAGLGYYRRARQLHAAAKAIVEQHGGVVPREAAALEKLPGIGRYTAGAIASTAYDEPAPILEANTVRVYARLSGSAGIAGDSKFMARLWQVARELVAGAKSPGRFNVAAMELGSLVCRPKPLCGECPVQENCAAFRLGVQEKIPTARPRRETIDLQVIGLALSNAAGEFLVRKIPAGEWHAGMWEFPTARLDADVGAGGLLSNAQAVVHDLIGPQEIALEFLTQLRYQVTHHRVKLSVYCGDLSAVQLKEITAVGRFDFLPLDKISGLPMGSAQKKLLKVLQETESSHTC